MKMTLIGLVLLTGVVQSSGADNNPCKGTVEKKEAAHKKFLSCIHCWEENNLDDPEPEVSCSISLKAFVKASKENKACQVAHAKNPSKS